MFVWTIATLVGFAQPYLSEYRDKIGFRRQVGGTFPEADRGQAWHVAAMLC